LELLQGKLRRVVSPLRLRRLTGFSRTGENTYSSKSGVETRGRRQRPSMSRLPDHHHEPPAAVTAASHGRGANLFGVPCLLLT
jgi:hypothetical protein